MRLRPPLFIACCVIAAILAADSQHLTIGQADEPARREPDSGPLAPVDTLGSFELHADFQIELVASEPLVQDPVAMAFDERGALYVVEYPEFNRYQFSRGVGRTGRVKRLQDTDADGRFDLATVFVEVPFATAAICYGGGVFVGAPPDILYCKDTDGDGVADEKRVVLTGFGRDFAGGGLLNSFRWGLDNRIHIATGFAGGLVGRPDQEDGAAVDVRSRGLLFDPRTLQFEPTSGGGQHGMSMDDWGNKFLCSNVYPLQMLMYDDRYAARNPFFAPPAPARNINGEGALAPLKRISPLEPWRVARSQLVTQDRQNAEESRAGGVFTSASGITVYRGDAFPAEFTGNLFVGEVANNLVYRARLESRGIKQVALRADGDAEFLASRDTWFRPVQFANGPDGALYIVDMYRQLIEGAAFVPQTSLAKLDPSLGIDRGRIYRVVPRSFKRPAWPNLDAHKTRELVGLLEHSNGWHRDTAARLLSERDDPAAIELLKRLARDSRLPQSRLRALYGLATQGSLDSRFLLPVLDDPDPRVRQHAVRLAESFVDSPAVSAALHARISDSDVRVRYQLAFTLGSVGGPNRNASLATLARRDASNRWMLLAVQSSLLSGSGDVLARLAADRKAIASEPIRRLLTDLAAQVGLQSDASEVAAVLQSLSALDAHDRDLAQAILRKLFAGIQPERIEGLRETGSADQMVRKLIQQARLLAVDNTKPIDRRLQAVRTLGVADFSDTELQRIFQQLLEHNQPASIQLATCETLARFDDPRVAVLLVARWPRMTPEVRGRIVSTLLSRTIWISALLDSVEAGQVSRNDVDPARIRLVADQADESLRARVVRLFPTRRSIGRESVVASYQTALELAGNVGNGKSVFAAACASCHRRKGVGKPIGPDLNDTARRSPESLLIEILDPNRQLKPPFQNYVLRTSDGRVLTGMIAEETANGIRLQQADGATIGVLRIQIESLQGTGISFMPDGLEKTISEQAMADLLAFLRL